MKKFISAFLSICLLLSLLGCQQSDISTTSSESTSPSDTVVSLDVPFTAVSVPSYTESEFADDGTVLFTKSAQHIALTLSGQAAADNIILDFLNRVDAATASANTVSAAAKSVYNGSDNWIPYTVGVQFNPTRIDQGILSLYGTTISYTGGSHPDYSCVAANYNLITGEALTLGSILTGVDAISKLKNLVLEDLKAQAEEKYLRSGYEDQVDQRFAVDESYDDDWYFSDTSLCFYFAPYEIAPYSSGVITAQIPYEKLIDIIAEEFFPPERQELSGTVKIVPFDSQTSSYGNISELVVANEGQMYALECDSCVQDLRIMITNPQDSSSYTAYAAHYLNPGDAIVIQCAPESLSTMSLQYRCGSETITLPLG